MKIPKILKVPVAAIVLIASVAWILLKAAFTILGLMGGRPEERDEVKQVLVLTDPDNEYHHLDP